MCRLHQDENGTNYFGVNDQLLEISRAFFVTDVYFIESADCLECFVSHKENLDQATMTMLDKYLQGVDPFLLDLILAPETKSATSGSFFFRAQLKNSNKCRVNLKF